MGTASAEATNRGAPSLGLSQAGYGGQPGNTRTPGLTRKEGGISQLNQGSSPYAARSGASAERRVASPQQPAEMPMATTGGNANSLRSLRDRLMRNQT